MTRRRRWTGRLCVGIAALLLLVFAMVVEVVPHRGHDDGFDQDCFVCRALPGLVSEAAPAIASVLVPAAPPSEVPSVLLPGSPHRPGTPLDRGPPQSL